MITETAIVIASTENWVEVELQRQSACGHCELSKGCGTGALARLIGKRKTSLKLKNDNSLRRGDTIVLGMSEQGLVKASLLVYGAPLMGLILAALLAFLIFGNREGIVLIAAGAGFVAAFKLSSVIARSKMTAYLTPKIIEVVVNPNNILRS